MSALPARSQEMLSKIFIDLRSKSEDVRAKAGESLRTFFDESSGDLLPTAYAEVGRDINQRITDLLKSNEISDKLGGIVAIDYLIENNSEVGSSQNLRFINFLRPVLPCNDPNVMVMASKTLGKLASSGETLTANSMNFEIKRALEWLQAADRNEPRRHAAVLILKELSQNAPTFMYGYVSQIVELIWVALRDIKLLIREAGAEALTACLKIVYTRDNQLKKTWYLRILEEIHKGLKYGTLESTHGSLLALKELLIESGSFMKEYYQEAGEIVLRYKDHREVLLRKAIVTLIPILASYSPSDFSNSYLQKCMVYLISQLHKEKEKSPCFKAIGQVAIAVGNKVTPFADSIVHCIKESLSARGGKGKVNVDPAIFECISSLSSASGASLAKQSTELLDMMFNTEIHEPLHQALVSLAKNIPTLLVPIQGRLLNLISMILSGQSYVPPGAPSQRAISSVQTIKELPTSDPYEVDSIILALTSLGSFDFTGHLLSEFVRDCLLLYLDCDNLEIRKLTALTCCKILSRDPIVDQTSAHAIEVMNEILNKLLSAGIADPDPSIRKTVLVNLKEKFNGHLSQANNVRFLFMALNDEVFSIRKAAITLIGRLANYNPAYVIPSLRKILIQLLTNLEYSDASRAKEESSILLGLIVNAAQHFVKPYIAPIVEVLMDKTKSSSSAVVASVLTALGELAQVGGEQLIPYLDSLMPLIIETLQDQSSLAKRNSSLKTLGQLTSSTGYVIEPYLKYPQLLSILVGILKTEESRTVRRETIKVMGILGALDPYKHVFKPLEEPGSKIAHTELHLLGIGPSAEDYYPTVAIQSLMKILKDPSLLNHHTMVIQAFMHIFKTLGLKCVPFLPKIVPACISTIRASPTVNLEFYFQQLGILVSIVKQHIRNYLTDVFSLIQEYWNSTSSIQKTLINLIEAISIALGGDFKVYIPQFLSNMLRVFDGSTTEKQSLRLRVLQAFMTFGTCVEEYSHLIIPVIIKVIEREDTPLAVKKTGLQTLAQMCKNSSCIDLASGIVHPLARVLAFPSPELRQAVMEALCILAYQLGHDYAIFVPLVNKAIIKHRIQYPSYDMLVVKILRNEIITPEFAASTETNTIEDHPEEASISEMSAPPKLNINESHLKKAWEVYQRSTKDDWVEWIRRLSVELIKESPSHALRSCYGLASNYHTLAKELFNAAFVSCWTELPDTYQEDLVQSLETALVSPSIPADILQMLLNLAEFMERNDKQIPINLRTLGAYASRCHAFAKALHYKELEFIHKPSTETIEALISINNQLQQPDAAVGVLTIARNHHDRVLMETWYEKLGRWDDALLAYDKKQNEKGQSFDIILGKMRCYHALGEWDVLGKLATESWEKADDAMRQAIAPLAAAAAWGVKNYENMDTYIAAMKPESSNEAFFRAILSLKKEEYDQARLNIDTARDLLDTELTTLIGESFSRAYGVVVRVQILAELDEVIDYIHFKHQPERRALIRASWMKRLKGCQRNVEVWQRTLQVRSMVISPSEDVELWIKFANLCRKSGRLSLSEKTIKMLLGSQVDFNQNVLPSGAPQVVYTYMKHRWASGFKRETLSQLHLFTQQLAANLNPENIEQYNGLGHSNTENKNTLAELRLLSRCYHRQGEWQVELQQNWDESSIPNILHSYRMSTQLDPSCYKAWHAWALANFEVISFYEQSTGVVSNEILATHIVPAVQGFFQSIRLSNINSLQDTLRLLTLWFKYAHHPDVNLAITDGFNNVNTDTWLQVIPQLIARIHAPNANVRRLVHHILNEVGKKHPQALIYPVTVASKSQSMPRKNAALSLMDKMRNHSPLLVEQALIVSQELIRIAILWHELWYEGLEEASRLYFGDHNIEAMLKTLEPLHAMLEQGPETLREISFNQAFGRDLQEAHEWCMKYKQTSNVNDLNQAWDLYYQVFRRISKQLPQLTTLELQYVSPKLLEAENLELAIPGSYKSGVSAVKIAGFSTTLTVITSKQRPRKLMIKGDDGKDYQYLLKGHEDLRQDERVMQLFGLVNTLLSSDPETFKRRLSIERYPVIPLSPNSGLIGWLPHCDTLHALIRDYRDSRKILLNIEHRLMLQMAPDYDNLTLLQKVEVFECALENTLGQDLYRVLWLKSQNSETWLDRRTNYTRSLALMSMVGYILGLGDRHPSNLMLDRFSGKVIHIDFGDCFEVAMLRDKFPEKIPFRLTRMLTNAMEVSGIEGNFRTTCENVMRVLRDNKESLMAVLEAFVYDPLINWRLLTHPSPNRAMSTDENTSSVAHRPLDNADEKMPKPEVLNQRAVTVIARVSNKLSGKDFNPNQPLDVPQQVDRLILQAISIENLCQCYIGWCAFW